MRLRLYVCEEVAGLLIPDLADFLVCGEDLARGCMVLDRLDWHSVVVIQGVHGNWVPHVIAQHFALFGTDSDLECLSGFERHRVDFLTLESLWQLQCMCLGALLHVPELHC